MRVSGTFSKSNVTIIAMHLQQKEKENYYRTATICQTASDMAQIIMCT